MKKFFKILMMTLVMLPCMMLFVACGETPPPEDPEPPTQEELNATGFTKLKTVMPAFLAQTGNKTVTSNETYTNSAKVYNADGTEITGTDYENLMGQSYENAVSTMKGKEVMTYNATTGEFAQRLYEENASHELVADADNYVTIKKVGNDYIRYMMDGGEPSVNYVSSNHAEKAHFAETMWSTEDTGAPTDVDPTDFATFADLIDYMEEELVSSMDFSISEDASVSLTGLFTEENDVWTMKLTLSMSGDNVEDGGTMDINVDIKIVFTDSGLNSFGTDMSLIMETEMATGEGEETVTLEYGMQVVSTEDYSTTFDSSIALTSTEAADYETITPTNAEANLCVSDIYGRNSYSGSTYAYGDSVADIVDYEKGLVDENVDVKLYLDEARTIEYDYTTATAPSYDMYLYLSLEPKEGYAVITETRELYIEEADTGNYLGHNYEQAIRVIAIADEGTYTYLTNVDFTDDGGEYDAYDTEVWDAVELNGEDKGTATTITLESGKVYHITYERTVLETTSAE